MMFVFNYPWGWKLPFFLRNKNIMYKKIKKKEEKQAVIGWEVRWSSDYDIPVGDLFEMSTTFYIEFVGNYKLNKYKYIIIYCLQK